MIPQRNISSIFSSNSEAFASELLENLEEMFPRYIHSGSLKASTTQWCATVAEELLFVMKECLLI